MLIAIIREGVHYCTLGAIPPPNPNVDAKPTGSKRLELVLKTVGKMFAHELPIMVPVLNDITVV